MPLAELGRQIPEDDFFFVATKILVGPFKCQCFFSTNNCEAAF